MGLPALEVHGWDVFKIWELNLGGSLIAGSAGNIDTYLVAELQNDPEGIPMSW